MIVDRTYNGYYITKGIIVAASRSGITIQQIANVYYECTGETWPFMKKGESHAIRFLEQIDGVLSILSEKNELLWYARGKTLNSENRGRIYRPNNPAKSSSLDLSTNPHGNIPNTCIQHNNNNNNLRSGLRSNTRKVDHNNNGYNDINGNYEPHNGMQQKYYRNDRMRVNGPSFNSTNKNDVCNSPGSSRRTGSGLYNYDLVGDD